MSRIQCWDIVSLRKDFKTEKGNILPKETTGRVLQMLNKNECKVRFTSPIYIKEIVPTEDLEFVSSHSNHTERALKKIFSPEV